jgi:hypothetical protein
VQSLPSSAFYIPDFISEDEEKTILDRIANAPKPRWKQLTHRRLQTWPSDLVKDALIDAPLPPWLEDPVISRLLSIPVSETDSDINIFTASPHRRPNHVLINEYPPGVGIMPHKVCYIDGEYVWEADSVIGWFSLSPCRMHREPRRQSLSEPVQDESGWHIGSESGLESSARTPKSPSHYGRPIYRLSSRNSGHYGRCESFRRHYL